MSRTQLLGAASAAVLASFTGFAHAASVMNGGGSTLAQYDYIAEFSAFNAASTGATFGSYWEAGSGSGQNGFLYDDLSCDINKVSGTNSGFCTGSTGSGPGTTGGQPGNTTVYGASDATLSNGLAPNPSSNQIAFWNSYTFGQALSGGLIQLPSMGVGISFPVQNANVVNNGDLSLSDHDLCEIFSGGYTDFSQITDAVSLTGAKGSYAPGAFKVVYRTDGSGTTFITTDHLAAVCKPGTDTPAGFTFAATTTFATLFTAANGGGSNSGGVVTSGLPGADGGKGSSGVAANLTAAAQAIGYLSPDFTTVDPHSFAPQTGLVVASVLQNKTPELPTVAAVTTGLSHAAAGYGYYTTPPSTAAQGANPANFVPLIAKNTAGYPVVGYTTFDFAQCYADPTITAGVISFLQAHYTKGTTEQTDQNDNGFVLVANSGASKFLAAINKHILTNGKDASGAVWNVNFGNTTLCDANAKGGKGTYIGR
jgi:phosphate transport system substrate-binding protein